MRRWSRKIRGILGLTIVGAVGGALDIDALSAWRGAAYGAVAGALAPVGLVFVLNGTFWVPGLGLLVGISSGIGRLLGGGVMIAGRNGP